MVREILAEASTAANGVLRSEAAALVDVNA
jgi:hypothetical protein